MLILGRLVHVVVRTAFWEYVYMYEQCSLEVSMIILGLSSMAALSRYALS